MHVELKSKDVLLQDDNLANELLELEEEEKGDDDKEGEYGDEDELADMGDMGGMGGNMHEDEEAQREYADANLIPGDSNDIFAEDNAENILERMNKMEVDAADVVQTSDSNATAITQQWEKDSRKDPEEEYFRLSCLALKIIYNEQDTDFVFTVSPGKLYQKCKKQKIPFHLWYNWIEKELQKVNETQKRAQAVENRPKSIIERI